MTLALIDADILMYRVLHRLNAPLVLELDIFEELQLELDRWMNGLSQFVDGDITPILITSGSNPFRKNVYPEYKANRSDLDKPEGYVFGRQAMLNLEVKAVRIYGLEADDVIGILMTSPRSENCVCVSIDKDLLQIPGRHYDPVKDKMTVVTPEEGQHRLLLQWAMGDSTDNIPGLPQIGVKRAEKMIAGNGCSAAAILRAYRDKGFDTAHARTMLGLVKILTHSDRMLGENKYRTHLGIVDPTTGEVFDE